MEIIDELEPTRRGIYGGASATSASPAPWTLHHDPNGGAHGRSGARPGRAGIVYDSDPAREHEECVRKARGTMAAVEMAETWNE
jgi:anthranilate synthase component 1